MILWRMSGVCPLVTPIGLWRADVALVHVSAHGHGAASPGWLSRRLISPWIVGGENAYLGERVVIPPDGSLDYLRHLVSRLRSGAVVALLGDFESRISVRASVAGYRVPFATGAPSLARLTGCALLPVFESWEGPQRYRVEIQEPISIDRTRSRHAASTTAIEEMAGRFNTWLADHPDSWRGWDRYDA